MDFILDLLAALYYGFLFSFWVEGGQKTEKRARFDLLQMQISDSWVSDQTIKDSMLRVIGQWKADNVFLRPLLDQIEKERPEVLRLILARIQEVKRQCAGNCKAA